MSFEDIFHRRSSLNAAVYLDAVPEEIRKIERLDAAGAKRCAAGCRNLEGVVMEDQPHVTYPSRSVAFRHTMQ